MQYIILKPDFKNYLKGTSLVVQWVIFCASTAGDSRFHPWSGKLRFSRLCSVAKKKKEKTTPDHHYRRLVQGIRCKLLVLMHTFHVLTF